MAVITQLSQLDFGGIYSYADYLLWRLEERVELIKGKIFHITPAPSRKHQRVCRGLIRPMLPFFPAGSRCELYTAPFEVRLYDSQKSQVENSEIFTVVQPDICVVCDKEKLDERGCLGAPDLVVEVLSPGYFKRDLTIKKSLYEENGVREYWVVFPEAEMVERYVLEIDGCFGMPVKFFAEDTLESVIFPDLSISLQSVFEE